MPRTIGAGLAFALCGLVLACGPAEEAEPEGQMGEMEAEGEMMGEMEGLTAADLAGTWTVRATSAAGDSVTTMQMNATSSRSGWTLTFPGRDPLPLRVVALEGDSVVTEVGPYESVLRQGVMVTTRMTSRLEGDRLVGTFVARYETTEPDSVLRGRLEGTRSP